MINKILVTATNIYAPAGAVVYSPALLGLWRLIHKAGNLLSVSTYHYPDQVGMTIREISGTFLAQLSYPYWDESTRFEDDHLMLLLLLAFLYSEPDGRTIQLSGGETASYLKWTLRLDSEERWSFDAQGQLELNIPLDSKSFEILDDRQTVRFFGMWSQFGNDRQISIEVGGRGLNMHQVVSASRIRQSAWEAKSEVGVVRPDEEPERTVTQTSDWLKEESEVLLQKTNLGGGSPIMRGMSGNRVLLMVDGFRVNNAIFRLGLNQYLNTVPGSQLEQIEVLSGPTGVQYGSDGLGGTIHLRSKDPAAEGETNFEYGGTLSTADGTNGHRLSGQGSHGNLFLQGHYAYHHYEDLEAGGDLGSQEATGYNAWDGALNLTYKFDESRRLRILNSQSEARHVPRTDRIVSGRDLLWEYHPQRWRLHGVRLETQQDAAWADYWELGLGYMQQDEGIRRISSSRPERLTEDRTRVDSFQFNGTFTKITRWVQWVYGFDSQRDELDTGATQQINGGIPSPIGTKFPPDAGYTSIGLFGTADVQIREDQSIRVGLRQTFVNLEGTLAQPIGAVDEDFRQLTPSVTWSLDRDIYFLSLGASQGFRAPNLEDALALGPSNAGFDAPNPGLEPEELWSYEANFRWRSWGGLYQASMYTSRYTSLIERVPGTYLGEDTFDGEPVFILDNVGRARINGATLSGRQPWRENHEISFDVSWTRGTETENDEPMRRIPPLRGNLNWQTRKGPWHWTGTFTWAERQDRLSPGDISDSRIPEGGTPGYAVFHLRGRYQFNPQFAINGGLENVGDRLYKQHGSGIYEPGRRFILRLEARWR